MGNTVNVIHFDGTRILIEPVRNPHWHYTKLEYVSSGDIPSFVAQAELIAERARPQYGQYYSGEYYDLAGTHRGQMADQLGERMTCVGFCLNILKGFLEEDYLSYQDWGEESNPEPGYLERYCASLDIDPETVRDSHRRITPIELQATARISSLPVSHADIQEFVPELRHFLQRSRQQNDSEE